MPQINHADYVWSNGAARQVLRANFSVAPATTDSVTGLPAAQGAGKQIVVLDYELHAGSVAATFQFNSKPAGAGAAISPVMNQIANGLKTNGSAYGLYVTNANEGLSITTGAGTGATTGSLRYIVIG